MADGWTIAGVIASSVSSLIAAGALSVAVLTMRRQAQDQRRSQASKVTFSVASHAQSIQRLEEFRIDNLSELPIYYPEVDVNPFREVDIDVMEEQGLFDYGGHWARRIDPGKSLIQRFDPPLSPMKQMRDIKIHFADASGRRWTRDIDGKLQER